MLLSRYATGAPSTSPPKGYPLDGSCASRTKSAGPVLPDDQSTVDSSTAPILSILDEGGHFVPDQMGAGGRDRARELRFPTRQQQWLTTRYVAYRPTTLLLSEPPQFFGLAVFGNLE